LLDGSINAMDKSHVWLISVWPVQVQTVPLTISINFAGMDAHQEKCQEHKLHDGPTM